MVKVNAVIPGWPPWNRAFQHCLMTFIPKIPFSEGDTHPSQSWPPCPFPLSPQWQSLGLHTRYRESSVHWQRQFQPVEIAFFSWVNVTKPLLKESLTEQCYLGSCGQYTGYSHSLNLHHNPRASSNNPRLLHFSLHSTSPDSSLMDSTFKH